MLLKNRKKRDGKSTDEIPLRNFGDFLHWKIEELDSDIRQIWGLGLLLIACFLYIVWQLSGGPVAKGFCFAALGVGLIGITRGTIARRQNKTVADRVMRNTTTLHRRGDS
jgi:hypothetical protein